MGGKEGSRGYVYQGIVAVLESFSLSFWDKIYVEFPTDDDKVDIALSFGNNIVRAIQVKNDVDQYIKDKQLPIGRKICCSLEYYGATTFSIQDGTHASLLANSVYALLAQRSTAERRAPLHLFAAAPNAFMFFLGRVSRGFGKCILYEYDFEQRDSCSYTPSIQFV